MNISRYRPTHYDFLRYILSIWRHLIAVTSVFALSVTSGYMYSLINPDFSINIISELSRLFGAMIWLPPHLLMLRIFMQNSILCFIALISGLAFGIAPIALIAYNGFILGSVIYATGYKQGVIFVLERLLPHGIIEIPAVLLSAAIGVRIGHEVLKKFCDNGSIKKVMIEGLKIYMFWVLPLLLIAAMIETLLII